MNLGGVIGRVVEGAAIGATAATVATAEGVALAADRATLGYPVYPPVAYAPYPGFVPPPPVLAVPYPVPVGVPVYGRPGFGPPPPHFGGPGFGHRW